LTPIGRRPSTPAAVGGAHGPAHGSSAVASARIVRRDEVQPATCDRGLSAPCTDAAADAPAAKGRRRSTAQTATKSAKRIEE
jgi:hypothetical protein